MLPQGEIFFRAARILRLLRARNRLVIVCGGPKKNPSDYNGRVDKTV
jgi:hypothetical protein